MVALYELFLTVLGREKLTPTVAELLLFLTSKAEVTVFQNSKKFQHGNSPGDGVEGGCSSEGARQQPSCSS